jgi:hypothetical protein
MATGRLGAADLAATTNTTLYTAPDGKYAVVTVSLTCRNATGAIVRLALSSTASPGNAEWLVYDRALSASGTLRDSGIVVGAGQYLVAYSSAASVSAVAFGIEESL